MANLWSLELIHLWITLIAYTNISGSKKKKKNPISNIGKTPSHRAELRKENHRVKKGSQRKWGTQKPKDWKNIKSFRECSFLEFEIIYFSHSNCSRFHSKAKNSTIFILNLKCNKIVLQPICRLLQHSVFFLAIFFFLWTSSPTILLQIA